MTRTTLTLKKKSAATVEPVAPAKQQPEQQTRLSAAERRHREFEKGKEAALILMQQYPAAFDKDNVRPLQVGIAKVLDAERKAGRLLIGTLALKRAIAYWVNRKEYLAAVAAGGDRIDMNGNPVVAVEEKHQAWAAGILEKVRKKASKEAA